MKIAILSDTQGPTPMDGSHGLGRACYNIAEGLLARGHDVTLYAPEGSRFNGRLIMPCKPGPAALEMVLAREALKESPAYDVIYDHGHTHPLSRLITSLPVVSHFHDKFQLWSRNAVLCSEGQRVLMLEDDKRFASARVIHNAIDASAFTPSYRANDNPPYVLFLGFIRDYKNPMLAIEACARARIKLIMCGNMVGNNDWLFSGAESTDYRGPVGPEVRDELLRGASVMLQLGHSEAGPLTNIESALSGTPVVMWPAGGSCDFGVEGVNGTFVDISKDDKVDAVIEAILRGQQICRKGVRESVEVHWGNMDRYIDDVEVALEDCAGGKRW